MKTKLQSLSHDVYLEDKKVIKEYKNNSFVIGFGSQEDVGLLNTGIDFNITSKGLEIEYIKHEPWNDEGTFEEKIEFVHWLKKFHKETSMDGLYEPGFHRAYFEVLNLALNKRGKRNWFKNEQGIVIDALKLLRQGDKVFLHNDLHRGNILKVGKGYRLIDFEYCGVGNSMFDIASFCTERKLTVEEMYKLAKTYDEDMNMDDFLIVCCFLLIFWARWASYYFQLTNDEVFEKLFNEKFAWYNELMGN